MDIFLPNSYLKKEEKINHQNLDKKDYKLDSNITNNTFISTSDSETSNRTSSEYISDDLSSEYISEDSADSSSTQITETSIGVSDLLDTELEGGKGKKGKKKKAKKKSKKSKKQKKKDKKKKKKDKDSEGEEPEEKEEPVEKEEEVVQNKTGDTEAETEKSMTSLGSTPVNQNVVTTPQILTKATLIEQLKNLAAMDPTLEVQIITGDEERRKYKKDVEKEDEKTGKYPIFYNQLRNFIE